MNPYVPFETADFKSAAFTDFATRAASRIIRAAQKKTGDPTDRISREFGAGNEARTRDLNLGKVALYQLSYTRIAWLNRLNLQFPPNRFCDLAKLAL